MIYVASDTHLGNKACDEAGFVRMVDECAGAKARMFLVGDVTDLWLRGWEFFVTRYYGLFGKMLPLVEEWVVGNHDVEVRALSSAPTGMNVSYPYTLKTVDGRIWLMEHGHRQGPLGWLFRTMDDVQRTDFTRKVARWVVRNPLLSSASKGGLYQQSIKDALADKAKAAGATVVVFGHTHQAELSTRDGIVFVNPGTSVGRHTFVTYHQGTFTLFGAEGNTFKREAIIHG